MDANKIDIKELMETFPWIPQKMQTLHRLINMYSDLMSSIGEGSVKAQVLSDMPRGSDISNPTQKEALYYQEVIDGYNDEIKGLRQKQKWCDKLRQELYGKDWEILYLVYSKQKSNWTIQHRLNINIKCVDDAILQATERARKLIN